MDDLDSPIPSLILEISLLIVADTSSLSFHVYKCEETTDLILVVNPEDEKKIIGPNATMIHAIRLILGCAARRFPRYRLTVITNSPDQGSPPSKMGEGMQMSPANQSVGNVRNNGPEMLIGA